MHQAIASGAETNCLASDTAPALDYAVLADHPELVEALLKGGADPNARWMSRGDRFPLQDVIEARAYGYSNQNRSQVVRLLLQYGADPNARWCPFESRASRTEPGCTSDRGYTPLIMAAAMDMADLTYQLLDAGADPWAANDAHATALDEASGAGVFQLLLSAMFPDVVNRDAAARRYLSTHEIRSFYGLAPWLQTPLARALVDFHDCRTTRQLANCFRSRRGRVDILLRLGVDPNERLVGLADWTPLAIAIIRADAVSVQQLLENGADPNLRWCSAIHAREFQSQEGCTRERGITPLMAAAAVGSDELTMLLLSAGGDPSLRDWRDRTAADYSAIR